MNEDLPRVIRIITWHVEEAHRVLSKPNVTRQDLLIAAGELAEALASVLCIAIDEFIVPSGHLPLFERTQKEVKP